MESLAKLQHLSDSSEESFELAIEKKSLKKDKLVFETSSDCLSEDKDEEENKDIHDSISIESFTIRARDISSNIFEENKNLEIIRRLSISENTIPQIANTDDSDSSFSDTQDGLGNLQINLLMGRDNHLVASSSSSSLGSSIITHFGGIGGRNLEIKAEPCDTNFNLIPKEDVKKLLTCYICYGQMGPNNNAMCAKCSKTYCGCCMKRVLSTDRKCPNCRVRLLKRSLRKNLLIEEIYETQNNEELQSQTPEEQSMLECPEHKEGIQMYCNACEAYVCIECISSGKHTGHDLKSLKHVFTQVKETSAEESKKLGEYIENLEVYENKFKKKGKVEDVAKAHQAIENLIISILDKKKTRTSQAYDFLDNKSMTISNKKKKMELLMKKIEAFTNENSTKQPTKSNICALKGMCKDIKKNTERNYDKELEKFYNEHYLKRIKLEQN